MAVTGSGGSVEIRDLSGRTLARHARPDAPRNFAVAFAPDRRRLAAGGRGLVVFDVNLPQAD